MAFDSINLHMFFSATQKC